MSSSVIEEKLFVALIELCNLLESPSFARDFAAASEMDSISGRRIAVAGLVKRGKSTFVNRVVGQDLSPVNLLPETSSVICFSSEKDARATGITFDGRCRKLSTKPSRFLEDVSREARKPLLAASYRGPLNLPTDFCLVDTPGAHESEVVANSLVESGMPSSLFRLCGGFIVVMGVPGLSAIDLQLLQRINKSAGESPVRVLLKGLDSSISHSELLEYSKEVLSDITNEIFVVSDENFNATSQLIDSFSVSRFYQPIDAIDSSDRVIELLLRQISGVLDSRDEAQELDISNSILKNLPIDFAEKVRRFAPGARERRKANQLKVTKQAAIDKYKFELNAWTIKDQELRRSITNADIAVADSKKNLRKAMPKTFALGCSCVLLSLFLLPLILFFPPVFFAFIILWIVYKVAASKEKSRFLKIEGSLTFQVASTKAASFQARMLHENHQKFKPDKPPR